MPKLSAVVLTKNEEQVISRCLDSLRWCDEIVLIDDDSIDETIQIATKYGANVYVRSLHNNFSAQRNFGSQKAKHDWILFVDADEVVSTKLQKSIAKVLSKPKYDSYSFQRTNILLYTPLTFREHSDNQLIRLVNKNFGTWKRKVHEYWATASETGKVEGELLHYSIESISDFIGKISRYSAIHTEEVKRERKNIQYYKVVFYPPMKFLKKYVLECAYRDGVRGFVMAVAMSFHSFLSWSQLWLEKR